MLSYVFSYGVMLLCLLIKDYLGSLYYLHLQSVRKCLNQIFHKLGRIGLKKNLEKLPSLLKLSRNNDYIFLFCFYNL